MKNKSKKLIKILCCLLLIVVINAMGYTYAKYVTSEKGTGQASVAKWAFKIVKEGEQSKKIQLIDTVNADSLVDGKIAPGSEGTIVISLDGTGSEVDINYNIQFENEQNRPNHMKFYYGGKSFDSLSEIDIIKGIIKHDDDERIRDIKITWRWLYETGTTIEEIAANDIIDTRDANTITQYTFDLVAIGTQSI